MIFKNTKDKLDAYEDPTGEFTNKQLRRAEWYLKHKILLEKIGVGILAAWCVGTIGFSLFAWGKYLFVGYMEDEQMAVRQLAEFQNYAALQLNYGARPLDLRDVRVYRSGKDLYDFTAFARNLNERWIAAIRYHFTYGGFETETAETKIMPGVERPIVVFGQESDRFPSGAKLIIDDISWKSVDPHQIKDVKAYMAERLMFSVDDLLFKRPDSSLKDGVPVQSISFRLTNNSAYSYWEPKFYVALMNGRQMSGIIFLSLERFRAGDNTPIDLRYFGDAISVNDVKVHPVIDVFDDDEFMKPSA